MDDFKLAWRLLFKNPAFTAVAVLSLALGIGANTAVFSLVNEFLLRTLPVRNPDELVLLRTVEGARGRMSRAGENNGLRDPVSGRNSSTSFSLLTFERLRTQRGAIAELFAFAPFSRVNVMVDGVPEVAAFAQLVSGNYHRGLGVPAAIGRTLTPSDDRADAPPVAVISHRFWQRRFAGDAAVVGRTIQINRVSTEIVGVTAHGFDGALQVGESPDVSVPLSHYLLFQPDRTGRSEPGYWWIRLMGRLSPGATPAQARATLEPLFQATAREGWLLGRTATNVGDPMPDDPALVMELGAQGENDVRRQVERPLRILMGLVSLVLVAACANVANLLLARGTSRHREIALRLALGAGRRRIVRQLLVEALVLSALGAALGLALAWSARGALIALQPFGPGALVDLPLDVRVLGFTFAAALLTTVVFGLVPALSAARVDLASEFQSGARALGGGYRSRLAQALTIVQIALSLVLLVSTGLFVRTLANLQAVQTGFDHHGLVLFRLDATSAGYTAEQAAGIQQRVLERLEGIPDVQSATFSSVALLSGVRQNKRVTVPGHTPARGASNIVNTNGLAPGFFSAIGLPILAGRGFTAADDRTAPRVAVVNQRFVRDYFGGQNPLGQPIVVGPAPTDRVEVVGVAADAKYTVIRGDMPPAIYFPAFQRLDGDASFAVRLRSAQQGGAVFAAIRGIVHDVDPALPVLNLRTQEAQLDRLHAPELLFARLSGSFGLVVMVLACVGLYGLLSHLVLRRTDEIGLRMGVGARPTQMLGMVLWESARLVVIGIVVGVATASYATRLIESMLYGLTPIDPLTYGGAALALVAAALTASLVPARRVTRIDPMTALRAD
jgi:predicted permease